MRRLPPVKHTSDFDRIRALPRRVITRADAEVWADVFTDRLRAHAHDKCRIKWEQGAAFAEILDVRGACCFLPVGIGKTLIFDLAPVLLGSQRPVAIMSAALRDKTWHDFEQHGKHWRRLRNPWQIISREELALDGNEDLLRRGRFDFVALEESDEYANLDRGAPARIDRYRYETWGDPNVVFTAFSGTPSRCSIMATWHLLVWCLREGAPVPLSRTEALIWAAALDERVRDPQSRPAPGPLGKTREAALKWYASRLRETPGVVIIDGDSCAQPLTIRTRLAREDSELDAHFEKFRKFGENPAGIIAEDDSDRNPLSQFRLDAQIGVGLCSYWDPPPPMPWREAYRAKAKFVRDMIAHTRALALNPRYRGPVCDTEKQVARAFADADPIVDWLAIRDTFRGKTKIKWLSRSAIDSVQGWLLESSDPGIVWCGSVEFARRLSVETCLPYYGAGAMTEDGAPLHDAPTGRSIICSWNANKKGFNLQAWSRALIVMPPQSAKWLEQIIGRVHRFGQLNAVTIDVLLGSGGTIDAFEAALIEAGFARATVSLTQKVLRAEIVRATPRNTPSNCFRWASRARDTGSAPATSSATAFTVRRRLRLAS
jgi:hypothetical protein